MTNIDILKDLSLAEIMGTHLNEEAVALVNEENEIVEGVDEKFFIYSYTEPELY